MLHAVIGIGSNSTRMLIAEIDGGEMKPCHRMREGTRIFAGLEEGVLSTESMLRTADAVARFAQEARRLQVDALHVIATSAVRDAHNAQELATLVQDICGVPMEVISGEEEAKLSFLGASGGQRAGMIDIGGGSTELAISTLQNPQWLASAQLGAVRLFAEVPQLGAGGFERALNIARERIAAAWEGMHAPLKPHLWYGVGGTLTCLASIDLRLPTFDREAVQGHTLGREAVRNWAHRLAKMTMEARAALPGMLSQRADIIAHGAIILLAAMEAIGIERVLVSNCTNLDGYLVRLVGDSRVDTVESVKTFYDTTVETEWGRLERHSFEFAINKRYIDRYVQPGQRVLDVGGGPGRYSLHLAQRGAQATLVDLSPGNVAFAREKAREAGIELTALCGDAREVDALVEGTFDTVLLMGPLYHLLTAEDREQAVRACLRVLKPGGTLIVAFISILGGMVYAGREMPESILWEDEDAFYNKIIEKDDFAGAAFTQAFFVEPSHVRPFMEGFPLKTLHLLSSEGITAPFHGNIAAQPPEVVEKWLDFSLAVCEREDLLCYAEHLLYIGQKKEEDA